MGVLLTALERAKLTFLPREYDSVNTLTRPVIRGNLLRVR